MAFLDNSGDIILDAVLTDLGRQRLSKGDGTFAITQFALGDDEINYANYNSSHASGSAYYDLTIKQTPVLEAFTNNSISLKSKLMTLSRQDLLYLPIIQLNEVVNGTATARHSTEKFLVMVDQDTENTSALQNVTGILTGFNPDQDGKYVRSDQGIDNSARPPTRPLRGDLLETQYNIEIDNRFGYVMSKDATVQAPLSFIDDDNIATYYLSLGTNGDFVERNQVKSSTAATQVIAGSRGTILNFKIAASDRLTDSNDLFDEIGTTTTVESTSVKIINSIVRVNGLTTGYSLDIPVSFIKV